MFKYLCTGTYMSMYFLPGLFQTFERVLVQNIVHGLSPSLCEALQSVSRWKVIQSALPHVLHCCSALLNERRQHDPLARFDNNQTKMLYTLHWIILDAASECEDNENETNSATGRSLYSYMYSLEVIQLFIYLFAPLLDTIRDSHFQSLKLENGLRLWQPMWDFRQPDIPCFSTPVKAKRIVLKAQRNLMKVNFNMANIYIGKGTSNDNIYLGPDDCPSPGGSMEASTPKAPLAHMSDICALSTSATETSVEIVCEICSETIQNRSGEMSCKCGVRRSSYMSAPLENKSASFTQGLGSPIDKEYVTKRLESVAATGGPGYSNPDALSASYFDVAVMRCLFCPMWEERGVYWALRYIHQRLLEVCDELNRKENTRERSHSLPVPEVQITPPDQLPPPTPPTPPKLLPLNPKYLNSNDKEQPKEPSFKRKRVAELKHMIGDKVKQLRRRESVEQFDLDVNRPSKEELSSGQASPEHLRSGKTSENELSETEEDLESCDSSDIVRRKSMPALRRHKRNIAEEEDDDSSGSGGKSSSKADRKDSVTRTLSLKPELLQKPIITITHDSPDPGSSPAWASKRESLVSEKSETTNRAATLQRSFTDSNIDYHSTDEVEEVPGSVYYIQSNGQLNYGVILKGIHAVSGRECSSRCCGVILNILNCLLDLGVIEKKKEKKRKSSQDNDSKSESKMEKFHRELEKEKENKKKNEEKDGKNGSDEKKSDKDKEKTWHSIAMETAIRYKHFKL